MINKDFLKQQQQYLSMGLFTLLMLFCMSGMAQIGVSPQLLVVNLDEQPRGHSFRLLNMSERDVSVEVSLANWEMDSNNQPQIIAPTIDSLDQWLIVNPLRFEVPAGQSQTVRLAFRPNQQLTAGEYRAMLYFTQILGPEAQQVGMFRSQFRIGAAIYAQVGQARQELSASPMRVLPMAADAASGGTQLAVDIDNRGNRHERMHGQWSLWRGDAYPGAKNTQLDASLNRPDAQLPEGMLAAGTLANTPVLPGTARTVLTSLQWPDELPAEVVLDINGQLGNLTLEQSISNIRPSAGAAAQPR